MNEQRGSSECQLSVLGLAVELSIPGEGDFASAASQWFREVPAYLAPTEWEEVLRQEKPPFKGKPQGEWPLFDEFQEPFMLWANIVVAPLKWHGMRIWHRRATARNLEWLQMVLTDRPVSARVSIFRVDANGIKLPGGLTMRAEAALDANGAQVPIGRLTAGETLTWRPAAMAKDAGQLCAQQAELARAWAGHPRVTSLFAGEEVGAMGETALAYSLVPRLNWWEAAMRWDLRGYSWITLCPAAVVERLGGAAVLSASGAFYRVDRIPGGSVLLRATERAADYGLNEARKAFEILSPVLPEGMPEKPAEWPSGLPWLVIPNGVSPVS